MIRVGNERSRASRRHRTTSFISTTARGETRLGSLSSRARPRLLTPGTRQFTFLIGLLGLAVGAGATLTALEVAGVGLTEAAAPTTSIVTKTLRVPSPLTGAVTGPVTASMASCVAEPTNLTTTGSSTAGEKADTQRYTARVSFVNRGNRGLTYAVTATWYLGDAAVATKQVRRNVPPLSSEQATVTAIVQAGSPSDRILMTRALRDTASCTTSVQLLHTFGASYH